MPRPKQLPAEEEPVDESQLGTEDRRMDELGDLLGEMRNKAWMESDQVKAQLVHMYRRAIDQVYRMPMNQKQYRQLRAAVNREAKDLLTQRERKEKENAEECKKFHQFHLRFPDELRHGWLHYEKRGMFVHMHERSPHHDIGTNYSMRMSHEQFLSAVYWGIFTPEPPADNDEEDESSES